MLNVKKIQQAIVKRLAQIEVTTVEIEPPTGFDPWEPFIGMWAIDPTWDEFQSEIEAYRQQINEETTNA